MTLKLLKALSVKTMANNPIKPLTEQIRTEMGTLAFDVSKRKITAQRGWCDLYSRFAAPRKCLRWVHSNPRFLLASMAPWLCRPLMTPDAEGGHGSIPDLAPGQKAGGQRLGRVSGDLGSGPSDLEQ